MAESYRKESRKEWNRSGDTVYDSDLKIGCLQRIADATELMAKRHQELVDDRDRWKRWHDLEEASAKRLLRSNIALRGQITKLKRAAAIRLLEEMN